jgi:predicted DNA-binding transcriptional regulator AlpA
MTDKLLTPRDLAELLRLSPETIKADARRNPDKLPPRFKRPGSNRILWRKEDVEQWLLKHSQEDAKR